MRFCEKLKEARTKAGLKQEELAKALGVSLRTITNYESGECYPRKRDIYHKLAELFHVQRLTVRGALNLLLQDKTIISKPRSGYYVAPKRILQSIRNFSLHSEEDSGQLTYELYDFKKIEADNYLASEMLLPEKSKIYKIVWLYSDGTQLICINTTYIPEYIYPDLTQQIAASAPLHPTAAP